MKILDVEKTYVPAGPGGMGQGAKIGWRVRYLDENSDIPICRVVSRMEAYYFRKMLRKQKKQMDKEPDDNLEKLRYGDLVWIMPHPDRNEPDCPVDEVGVVTARQFEVTFGYGSKELYSLYIKNYGFIKWFDKKQLRLVQRNRDDLFKKWKELDEKLYLVEG